MQQSIVHTQYFLITLLLLYQCLLFFGYHGNRVIIYDLVWKFALPGVVGTGKGEGKVGHNLTE